MRKKTILMAAILSTAFFTSSVFAQGQKQQENRGQSKSGSNWFISLGAGGNLLLGEQDSETSKNRITMGGEFSLGKWFNPYFGMRTQIYVGALRGYNLMEYKGGEYTREDRGRDPYPTGYYNNDLKLTDNGTAFWQDFNYSSVTIDLMANLTNLFRGYYKEAPVEFMPFAGIGWLHGVKSSSNPVFDGPVAKLGMRVNFNLNSQWAIYLEPQASVMSSEFDGYVGNRTLDAVCNLAAGVQFNINKNFSCVASLSQDEIDRLNSRINEQHQMIENQQNILERQQQMLNNLNNEKPVSNNNRTEPQQPTYRSDSKAYLPDYIRFGLNSANVELVERTKLEDAANYLKAHPTSKLMLVGYADKKTGNSSHNYKLSCRRAEAVAEILQRNGIEKGRLIIECVGDKEQPYDQNDWNRVVIMVER